MYEIHEINAFKYAYVCGHSSMFAVSMIADVM